ncbi:sensor histidine kinase [Solirubrobacter soli]|uniref:sensor histidine kinase n=1 Tax=Solirubrobacter soli TaxID=363832 RepID=UPI0004205C86|nr:histidine kinase [Solirubrobacter soli]
MGIPSTCVVAALGVAAAAHARAHPADTLTGGEAAALALMLVAGLGAWVAGVYVAPRDRGGIALAAAGPALFLAAWPLPEAGGALAFTAALTLGATAPALAATAALLHRRAPRRGRESVAPAQAGVAARAGSRVPPALAVAALAATAGWLGLLATATFDPEATGCFDCPRNLLLVVSDADLHDALVHSGLYAAALTCAAAGLLGLRRRAAAAAAALLGAAGFAVNATHGVPTIDETTRTLWLAQTTALAVAAGTVAFEYVRARRLSRRIADLVAAALPSPVGLRAAFGDPGLEIVFPHGAGAVDADGRPAPASPGRAVTQVTRGADVIAELRHDQATAEHVAAAARGAGLALEHASLRARVRAELSELAASRRRIVEVGDAERRRIERDLHDGAQQRLIALSMTLDDRARDEVKAALADLRALAHGIHPAALTDAGLESATLELADEAAVPLKIEAMPHNRLHPSLESAVYRLILDGVRCAERHGDGRAVRITVERDAEQVSARIALPGVALPALQDAADRFEALGGTLAIASGGAEGRLPCGS